MNQAEYIAKYGNPLVSEAKKLAFERKFMDVWKYGPTIQTHIPVLGTSIYINKDFRPNFELFLIELIKRNLHIEITENDQCFMPRYQRGSKTAISVHTWGCAIDLNPSQNPIFNTREQCLAKGLKPFSLEFIQCVRDCGLLTGADFSGRPDLMHIEMK
jgi:hypothetical protein